MKMAATPANNTAISGSVRAADAGSGHPVGLADRVFFHCGAETDVVRGRKSCGSHFNFGQFFRFTVGFGE
jgi:hypothetical protein